MTRSRPARRPWWATGPLLLLLLALPRPAPAAGEARPGWTWEVTADEALTRLEVRLCFEGFAPRRLRLPRPAALPALEVLQGEGLCPLQVEGDALVPGACGPDGCLAYRVDLSRLESLRLASRHGRDLLTDPGAWLLAPARFTERERARCRLHLPAGLHASVPWAPQPDGAWSIPDTGLLFPSRVAFVRTPPRTRLLGGLPFTLAVLEGARVASDAGIDAWLGAAVECVSQPWGGRFPIPRAQVVVGPSGPSSDPVDFGHAYQSGGAAVVLDLASNARDGDLPLEWILVHELLHLAMPWIVGEDAWLGEGFVTYWQEVLRGRAGAFGAAGPWQALEEGFQRGLSQPSMRTLAEDSRDMHARHLYYRVYWSGAALSLRMDVALQQETRGRTSLDDVLRLWSSAPFRARRGWRALDLLAETERVLGVRSLRATVAPALASERFPDPEDTYPSLGLVRRGPGRVAVLGSPQAEALRQRIGGRPPVPSLATGSAP
ncbi:MAG: hypothetical protein ACKOSS_03135 [Planctomycetia bacterium]